MMKRRTFLKIISGIVIAPTSFIPAAPAAPIDLSGDFDIQVDVGYMDEMRISKGAKWDKGFYYTPYIPYIGV